MPVYSARKPTTLVDKNGTDIAQSALMMKTKSRTGSIMPSAHTPLVDERTGEYNGVSTKDLVGVMESLLQKVKTGEFQPEKPTSSILQGEGAKLVQAAINDDHPAQNPGGPWQVLGEVFTDDIYETMGRTAFADKVLAHQDVPEMGQARIRIHRKDVVAWAMAGDGIVAESFIKQGWNYPKGFDLEANVVMQCSELHEAGSQLLEEKYQDALEATLVREDRMLKFLLDRAAVAPNDVLLFPSFTPSTYTSLRRQIIDQGIAVPHMIMAIDVMDDLFKDTDWQGWYSPIEKHELAMEGRLGKLGDIEIITDGLRYPELKVLDPGEVYMLGAPQALGMKSLMIPLRSSVVDQTVIGRAVKGWFLLQREALTVSNSRSVSKGLRV